MNATEHLTATAWKSPDSYGGFDPIGDYCIMSQSRDSDALSRSNWRVACDQLKAEPFDDGRYSMTDAEFDARPAVYHWRAGHWACGWIEYLMVRADASSATLEAAGEIVCAIAEYPALDEEHFSELEMAEAEGYWARMSVKERAEVCKRAEVSIFAARHDYPPSDDSGFIYESLRA